MKYFSMIDLNILTFLSKIRKSTNIHYTFLNKGETKYICKGVLSILKISININEPEI